MKTGKNRNVDQILSSLDKIEKAEMPDFFYTRLKARMERELLSKPPVRSWLFRPAFAFTALIVVIIINVAVFLKDKLSDKELPATETEILQSIASEYNINSNLTYEINQ